MGLKGYNKRFVNELSGGQIQRVAIARCIAKECKVLLCDEPTSSLDEDNSINVFSLLKELSKSILVVVSSHNRELVEQYSDYIIIIKDGKVEPLLLDSDESFPVIKKDDVPIKKIVKIGGRHLKRKKNKLVLTSLLCFLSSVFLSSMFSAFSYNEKNLAIREYIKDNDNYIALRKINGGSLTEEDVMSVNSELDTSFLLGRHIDSQIDNVKIGEYGEKILTAFDCQTISNIVTYNKNFFNSNDFILLAGSLPDEEGEIVLTDYTYQIFHKYGYYDYASKETHEIESYEDLVGKALRFSSFFNSELTVSGIVDTYFNYSKYNKYKRIDSNERPSNNRDRYMYTFDYISIMKDSIHSSVFLYDFNSFINSHNKDNFNKLEPNVMIDTAAKKETLIKLSSNKKYIMKHYAFEKAETTTDYLIPIRNVLTILGFVLFIASFLTQLNYMKLSISGGSNEIKLLNSVGFKRKDIRHIFSFELLFVSTVSSTLSILTSVGFVIATNYCFDNYLAVYTGVIFFQPYLPIAIILMNIFASFIALFISFRLRNLLTIS